MPSLFECRLHYGLEIGTPFLAEDSLVCTLCAPMDGKVISVNENFFDKGDTAQGSDGSSFDITYSDVETPPLHPDCRCYIRPEDLSE